MSRVAASGGRSAIADTCCAPQRQCRCIRPDRAVTSPYPSLFSCSPSCPRSCESGRRPPSRNEAGPSGGRRRGPQHLVLCRTPRPAGSAFPRSGHSQRPSSFNTIKTSLRWTGLQHVYRKSLQQQWSPQRRQPRSHTHKRSSSFVQKAPLRRSLSR